MHNHLDQDDGRAPSYHDFASLLHSPWRNLHFSCITQRTSSVLLTWDIQSNLEFNSSWYNFYRVVVWTSEIVLPSSWESNASHWLVQHLQYVWSVLGFHPTTNFSLSLEPRVDCLLFPFILYCLWACCPLQWPHTVTHTCPWFFWTHGWPSSDTSVIQYMTWPVSTSVRPLFVFFDVEAEAYMLHIRYLIN
jgi:hypothetical protein